ncbi:MAG: polysaccharide deacetylase family protein, partial [Dermatophilaceae bacterium]
MRHQTDVRAPKAVFFDNTGRRWRRIRWVGGPLIAVLLVAATVGAVVSMTPPHADLSTRPTVSKRDTGAHIPVIGIGPLDRVIAMDRSESGAVRGVDPFTGQQVGTLTEDEVEQVASSPYALQRYGYSAGAHKTITLTYDDGPNPEATPQLLDLLGREKVPATFFVVGRYAAQNPDLVRRIVHEGH